MRIREMQLKTIHFLLVNSRINDFVCSLIYLFNSLLCSNIVISALLRFQKCLSLLCLEKDLTKAN